MARKQDVQLKKTINSRSERIVHKKSVSALLTPTNTTNSNPWSPDDVDKLEPKEFDDFKGKLDYSRFFYERDPLASIVINKLVDIAVNDLTFKKNGITDNQLTIFTGIKDALKEFCEAMALEYFISGFVIPEVKYTTVGKRELDEINVNRYSSLQLPTNMWMRDPRTVEIKPSLLGNEPTYLIEIPKELIYFIQHEGKYSTGEEDLELYRKLLAEYPEFVEAIRKNKTKIKLENDLIFKRRVVTGKTYPIPFLTPAIEDLRHKRNLRRMDYSVAARVISAIQLFTLGSDEFPVTEEDGDVFEDIKSQMMWRESGGMDIERVFQLFANHTLQISWIFPPVEVLLDDKKYNEVNKDILLALGVSKTLLIGEAERTGTSSPELSTVGAVKTMENLRNKLLIVINNICQQISIRNGFSSTPVARFLPLNLTLFKDFATALEALYSSGNVSREEYAKFFGYDWSDEMDKKEKEQEVLKEKELGEFAPAQFSPTPTTPGTTNNRSQVPDKAKMGAN